MDNVTIYGLATLGTGVIGLAIRYSFKSKCEDVSLCFGLIKIHRDTESEVKAEELELRHQPTKQESIKNLGDNVV
tara:strand:- start:807 stop:1031 length:225 start_codon:yes stop_codon:yes gene_type:complete